MIKQHLIEYSATVEHLKHTSILCANTVTISGIVYKHAPALKQNGGEPPHTLCTKICGVDREPDQEVMQASTM